MTTISNNPSGADNQQGSPSAVEISYLAGLFDGEGWIGIQRSLRKSTGKNRYSASSAITTTSPRLSARVHDILTRAGIKHYFVEMPARMGKDGSWRRRKWNITTAGNAPTEEFIYLLLPYLVEKREQAGYVLDYIGWRKQFPRNLGKNNDLIGAYAENVMAKLTRDRQQYDPSTTTRLAPQGEDIV